MTEDEHQAERDRDAAAWRIGREAMTDEQREHQREVERFRKRSWQYKKGLAYHEDFDPKCVSGGRHYITRYMDDNREVERVCRYCNAWEFADETPGCCCRNGLVCVPPSRKAPTQLRTLFDNPTFMRSIRVYNNGFAFTSMGASLSRSLTVDETVTRDGVYNFRVKGSVCSRLGSLLYPRYGRAMFALVYINDPDMEARVASRMRKTDGLDSAILRKIDRVMAVPNEYTQHFLNVRSILVRRAGPEYEAVLAEHERRRAAAEFKPDDDPALHLQDYIPPDRLRLHVTRNAIQEPTTYSPRPK